MINRLPLFYEIPDQKLEGRSAASKPFSAKEKFDHQEPTNIDSFSQKDLFKQTVIQQ